jgi:hypothetical protein
MSDMNKRNLVYFENPSMRGLYTSMEEWQQTNNRRLCLLASSKIVAITAASPSLIPLRSLLQAQTGIRTRG